MAPSPLKDPWGNDYQYVYPGTHGREYDLYSFGADGQEGGEGEDADIGNWNLDAKPATTRAPPAPDRCVAPAASR